MPRFEPGFGYKVTFDTALIKIEAMQAVKAWFLRNVYKTKVIMRILVFISLLSTLSRGCYLAYRFKSVCKHFNYSKSACIPGNEKVCTPFKTTFNNPRCPIYICVSWYHSLSFSKLFSMCLERHLFCQCCKKFLKILSINKCSPTVKCRKVVYSKFNHFCDDCQQCCQLCCRLKKVPRCWVQKDPFQVAGFNLVDNKIEILLKNTLTINKMYF